ncbi:MAG: Hpt domain-containing protein [Thermodesulfobacteriota bacterium]
MSPINIAHIIDCIGPSADLIQKLIDHLLVTVPEHTATIEKAIASGDAVTLQRTSHTLKGSLSYLKAEGALALVRALEQAGRDDRIADAVPLLEAFRAEAADILDYLRSGEWKEEINGKSD